MPQRSIKVNMQQLARMATMLAIAVNLESNHKVDLIRFLMLVTGNHTNQPIIEISKYNSQFNISHISPSNIGETFYLYPLKFTSDEIEWKLSTVTSADFIVVTAGPVWNQP